MNFVVGSMLLIMQEEEAFWLLAALIENVLPSDYFTCTLHLWLVALLVSSRKI